MRETAIFSQIDSHSLIVIESLSPGLAQYIATEIKTASFLVVKYGHVTIFGQSEESARHVSIIWDHDLDDRSCINLF